MHPTTSRRTRVGRRLPTLLLAAAAALAGPAALARAADVPADLVLEAGRRARSQDVKGAIGLLEKAIAADPRCAEAHVLYQELARDALGPTAIENQYREQAAKAPDDPLFAYLATRLLPPEAAVAEFEKLSLRFKASPWPRAGRARALERLGRFGDALAAHDEAVVLAGQDAPRFLAFKAFGQERAGEWESAAATWRSVLEKRPEDRGARLGLGEALRRAGRWPDALDVFQSAARSHPQDPEPPYRVGLVQMDAGRYQDAASAFDAAIAIDKGMLEALCGASEASLRLALEQAEATGTPAELGAFQPALSYADRAVAAWPDSPYAQFALGAVHEAMGEVDADHLGQALEAYGRVLELCPLPGPERVRGLVARSFVLLRRAEWEPATDAAQKALDIDARAALAYAHGGHALSAQGKQEEAIRRFYRPGIKQLPDDARLRHDHGVALWELGKESDARRELEQAVKLAPRNGRFRTTLGELYYATGKYKDAAEELLAAVDALPRDVDAWAAYARACYSAKQWKQAVQAFEKIIELDPDTVSEHLYAAVVLADQLDDREQAKAHLAKFREKGGRDEALDVWIDALLTEK